MAETSVESRSGLVAVLTALRDRGARAGIVTAAALVGISADLDDFALGHLIHHFEVEARDKTRVLRRLEVNDAGPSMSATPSTT